MTDIYLNPTTGDIDLTNNTMRLTNNTQELTSQRVDIWLSMFRGEWFYNILSGIPYLANDNNREQLLGNTNKGIFDIAIRTGITTRQGIQRLDSYESILDPARRTLTVSFSATTQSGEIVNVQNIEIPV